MIGGAGWNSQNRRAVLRVGDFPKHVTSSTYWKRYLLIQLWFTLAFAPVSNYLDVKGGLDWHSSLVFYLVESLLLALWMI